jgi:energy-converting hydrogenase Eha subunit H
MDWYIKWFASITLIIAGALVALNMYPYSMYFQLVGLTGWLIVGIMWKDWALIVVNVVGVLIMLAGIINYHFFTDWYLIIYDTYIEARALLYK